MTSPPHRERRSTGGSGRSASSASSSLSPRPRTDTTTTTKGQVTGSKSTPQMTKSTPATPTTPKTKQKTTPKTSSSSAKKQRRQRLDRVLRDALPDAGQELCLMFDIHDHQQFLTTKTSHLAEQLQESRRQSQQLPPLKNPSQYISQWKNKIKTYQRQHQQQHPKIDREENGQEEEDDEDDVDEEVDEDEVEPVDHLKRLYDSNSVIPAYTRQQQDRQNDGDDDDGHDYDDEDNKGASATKKDKEKSTTSKSKSKASTKSMVVSIDDADDHDKADVEEVDDSNMTNTDGSVSVRSKGKSRSKENWDADIIADAEKRLSSSLNTTTSTRNGGDGDDDVMVDYSGQTAVTPTAGRSDEKTSGRKNKKQRLGKSPGDGLQNVDRDPQVDDHMDLLSNIEDLSQAHSTKVSEIAKGAAGTVHDSVPLKLHVRAHRVRHLKYMPQAVVNIAANDYGGYVAVSRADGSIELNVMGTVRGYDGQQGNYSSQSEVDRSKFGGKDVPHLQPISKIAGVDLLHPSQSMIASTEVSDHEDKSTIKWEGSPAVAANSMAWVPAGHGGRSRVLVAANNKLGSIWTVDFERSRHRSPFPSGGGCIYDLSACHNCNWELPLVAGACEDGSIRVWRVEKQKFQPPKIFDVPIFVLPVAGGAPILSLAWRCEAISSESTSTNRKAKVFHTVLFAAVADGTIRKYKLDLIREHMMAQELDDEDIHSVRYAARNHASLLRMTVESKGLMTATKVWAMKALSDGTLVASNSLGQVQIWDSFQGTLLQTFDQADNGLQADTCALAVNKAETKIFCSGVDPVVVSIERLKPGLDSVWRKAAKMRPHTNDVRSLAIVEAVMPHNITDEATRSSPGLEFLVSGGVDTTLGGCDVDKFTSMRPREWRPWPTDNPISNTFGNNEIGRFFAFRRSTSIDLYQCSQIGRTKDEDRDSIRLPPDQAAGAVRRRVKSLPAVDSLGTIHFKAGGPSNGNVRTTLTHLQASKVSPNGRWLAASNAAQTFLYHLGPTIETSNDDDIRVSRQECLRPQKVVLSKKLPPATAFHFWDSYLFLADANRRRILVVQLSESNDDKNSTVDETGTSATLESNHGRFSASPQAALCRLKLTLPELIYHRTTIALPVHDIKSSRTGEYVATMSHQEGNQAISIFRASERDQDESKGHTYQFYWTLPSLGTTTRPAAMSFIGDDKLAVATYQSHLYIFDLVNKRPTPWSEMNQFPVIHPERWTEDLLCRNDFPVRLAVDPRNENLLIMSSFETFCLIRLDRPMPRFCRYVPDEHMRGRKKRKSPKMLDENNDTSEDRHWLLQPYDERRGTVLEDGKGPSLNIQHQQSTDSVKTRKGGEGGEELAVGAEIAAKDTAERDCTICVHYQGMLHLDFISTKEMIVVEESWFRIQEQLPDPLHRRQYGHGI